MEQLIVHALTALRDTLTQDQELTLDNVTIAFVGPKESFTVIEGAGVLPFLAKIDGGRNGSGGIDPAPTVESIVDDAPMETE